MSTLRSEYRENDSSGPHRNHALYNEYAQQWREIRDAIEGERAIIAGGSLYLERPGAFSDDEYRAFQRRAEYPEAVARTHKGIGDRVFSKPQTTRLPNRLDEIKNRLDGSGLTHDDLLRWVLDEAAALHRAGLLADFDDAASEPRIRRYAAESIYNWRFSADGRLVMLVVDEPGSFRGGDIFDEGAVPGRRVFFVDDAASPPRTFSVVYRRVEDKAGARWLLDGAEREILIAGNPAGSIPFVFVGGGAKIHASVLRALTSLARHYYNVSADKRHQLHSSAFVQWFITMTTSESDVGDVTIDTGVDLYGRTRNEGDPLTVEMGSARVLMLRNARPDVVAPPGTTISAHREELGDLRRAMIAHGARIFDQDATTNIAAETVWLQNSGGATSVASLAQLCGRAVTEALRLCAALMNENAAEVSVEYNKDYFDDKFTLGDIPALITGVDEGLFTKRDARAFMRRGGIPLRADEEIEADIAGGETAKDGAVAKADGSSKESVLRRDEV